MRKDDVKDDVVGTSSCRSEAGVHGRAADPLRCSRLVVGFVCLVSACAPIPELEITTDDARSTSESGHTVAIRVRLAHRPHYAIKVHGESSDDTEGVVSGELRFDAHNWRAPQVLIVEGVDDAVADGDVDYHIRIKARPASEPADEPDVVEVVELVNLDDDFATLERLGDLPLGEVASQVVAMSTTGDVIVGNSAAVDGSRGVRWARGEGVVDLGPGSSARAVSPDGRLVLGTAPATESAPARPGAVWIPGQEPLLVAPLGMTASPERPIVMVHASVVRDDATVLGDCLQYAAYGTPFACSLDRAGTLSPLSAASYVRAADAQHYVGARVANRYEPVGTRATLDGRILGYLTTCYSPRECRSDAYDFSADASVVVGEGLSPPAGSDPTSPQPLVQVAFVYTIEAGMRALPDLPGGTEHGAAYTVSGDGRIVGGYGTDATGRQAVVWIDGKVQPLHALIAGAGSQPPEGFRLLEVIAVSADGHTFAGNALNAEGRPEGFRVFFPPSEEPSAVASAR